MCCLCPVSASKLEIILKNLISFLVLDGNFENLNVLIKFLSP